jgi:hypothetical protein
LVGSAFCFDRIPKSLDFTFVGERESLGGQSTPEYFANGGRSARHASHEAPIVKRRRLFFREHDLQTFNPPECDALAAPEGRIEVRWSHPGDGLPTLRWLETGDPPVKPPTRQGFGHRVMERTIGQTKGKSSFDWRPQGLACEFAFRT